MPRNGRRGDRGGHGNKKQEPTDNPSGLLTTIRDDLRFLRQINFEAPNPTLARLASVVLRRLLHENNLAMAWVAAGFSRPFEVTARDIDEALKDVPREFIEYCYAGRHANLLDMAFFNVPAATPDQEAKAEALVEAIRALDFDNFARTHTIDEFKASSAAMVGHSSISRLHVIRYVSDKLGGAHFDNRRADWSHPNGARDRFLDEEHVRFGALSGPLNEVISAAEAIATAADTELLLNTIDALFPPAENQPYAVYFRETRDGPWLEIGAKGPATGARTPHVFAKRLTQGDVDAYHKFKREGR